MQNRSIFIKLLVLVFLSGCINENQNECFETFYISFSYHGDGEENIFHQKVKTLDLIVLDEQRDLVMQKKLSAKEVRQAKCKINLPKGAHYKVLAFANIAENYSSLQLIGGAGKATELEIITKPIQDKYLNQIPLYQGEISIHTKQEGAHFQLQLFNKHHFKVKLEIKGLANTPYDVKDITVEIFDIPTSIQLDPDLVTTCNVIHPELKQYNQNLVSDVVYLFRPPSFEQTKIQISYKGQPIDTIWIKDLIGKDNTALWCNQELLLPIQIIFQQLEVEVVVPFWKIDDLITDFN